MYKVTFLLSELLAAMDASKKLKRNKFIPATEGWHVKVDASIGVADITATNLETVVKCAILCDVQTDSFEFVLPPEILKALQAFDKSGKLDIELQITGEGKDEKHTLLITQGSDKVKKSTYLASDFPAAPRIAKYNSYATAPAKDFLPDLKLLSAKVKKDDLRKNLECVVIAPQSEGRGAYLYATDTHQLAKLNAGYMSHEFDHNTNRNQWLSIHSSIAAILLSGKPDGTMQFSTAVSQAELGRCEKLNAGATKPVDPEITHVCVKYSINDMPVTIISRTQDAPPDFEYVIPYDNSIAFTFDKAEAIKVLKKSAAIVGADMAVALNFSADKCAVSSIDVDLESEYTSEIAATGKPGEAIRIGFINDKLTDLLNFELLGNSITLKLDNPRRAAIVEFERGLLLLMPVMLSN